MFDRDTSLSAKVLRIASMPDGLAAAQAASLGFSHGLLPDEPGWQDAMDAAKQAGLVPLLDVALDRVPATLLAEDRDAPFHPHDASVLLDPRHHADEGEAVPSLASPAEAEHFAAWWGRRLRAALDAGVAGFRLRGFAALGSALPGVLRAVRREVDGALLLGWTPGLAWERFGSLEAADFDAICGSLPWWDFASAWFWNEFEALSRVAPVMGTTAAPDGGFLRSDAASWFAALLGRGWIAHVTSGSAAEINAFLAEARLADGAPALPLGTGGRALALLRGDAPDLRRAGRLVLAVLNPTDKEVSIRADALLESCAGACFDGVSGNSVIALPPGGAQVFRGEAAPPRRTAKPIEPDSARAAAHAPRLAIEAVAPAVDDGAFPAKRIVGELVSVTADVVFDGHEKIAAALRWRAGGQESWQEMPMVPLGNDRWAASFPLEALGLHEFAVVAWRDRWETFRDEVAKKHAAGVPTALESQEGEALLASIARNPGGEAVGRALAAAKRLSEDERREALLAPGLAADVREADDRPFLVASRPYTVEADRPGARFASWYEVFPRSLSDDERRHGTFGDVVRHLPRIRDMGFDVLYFPPIHPIGRKNRKGRNNSLEPAPDDPGSPYAIGSDEGGHTAIHPELGTIEDFRKLRDAAAQHGLELALDFAIQCSPDHPWLREHPGWFDWRPDGSIKYAENPPKKYQDIVNVDFYARDAVPGLWQALADAVLFWAREGVRLFRVDNPHTKPFPFWQWMIAEVRARYPDTVFLAEAFTRPKIMARLAKIGFGQSYTYFTWRNTKSELTEYLTQLTEGPEREFFRPHFFVNTPDINPVFLQTSGRGGFLIRAALASTLSGLWGVYCGFELCEGTPLPGREEYANSEKYQLRAWDWARPGNIVAEISRLNRIRRENPALRSHLGVAFLNAWNDAILYYRKATPDRSNYLLIAVSLDPHQAQAADFEVPLWEFGLPDDAAIGAENLMTGERLAFQGKRQHLTLTPDNPFVIWRLSNA